MLDYESMTTQKLQEILRRDAETERGDTLPTDTILEICRILTERSSVKQDVNAAYRRFQKYYMPHK